MLLNWEDVVHEALCLAERHKDEPVTSVYGIPSNGSIVAVIVATILNVRIADHPTTGTLIVDDLVDSGATANRYKQFGLPIDTLFRKPHSPKDIAPDAKLVTEWVTFPWEKQEGDATDGVIRILSHIGEDPTREGLQDTPKRVIKAFKEMTEGYNHNIAQILGTTFDVGNVDEMIVVTGIDFVSLCEHHMLPFTGTATVAYIPKNRVVGLSKIARTVEAFAKRLQVQERLTTQITDALDFHLETQGSAALIQAHHACMGCRGVKKPNATMITSSLTGIFRTDPNTRNEFLTLARHP